ncbi:MAG: hypothetical protein GX280_07965 [Lentisphaerae bacterium]|jgi:hypothetical protein|nr:hypothetical protein [Victivallaceae bacterium]NLK83998.1 hypothetical protein [Lentisphaerota bacterium]
MKKFLVGMSFAVVMLTGTAVQAQWLEKVALYVPNRVIDLLDSFTLNLGAGPTLRGELRATHAVQIGGGFGYTAKLVKDINRQYGAALQEGWSWYVPGISSENIERRNQTRWVRNFYRETYGFPYPADEYYNYHEGACDYWEFGGTLGALLIEADVSVHPIEMVDALLGFILIDIKGDDLTFESFQ